MKQDNFFLCNEAVQKPYHYKGAGLEGIYLLNGYCREEVDGETHVSITDIEGLHNAIGRHLVTHRKALTPREIRFLRNTMGMTQASLAECLGNNSQSVARWEKGETEMPGTSEKLLRAVFMASLLPTDDLVVLRDLLVTKLGELDEMDEVGAAPAQFELYDNWHEKEQKLAFA